MALYTESAPSGEAETSVNSGPWLSSPEISSLHSNIDDGGIESLSYKVKYDTVAKLNNRCVVEIEITVARSSQRRKLHGLFLRSIRCTSIQRHALLKWYRKDNEANNFNITLIFIKFILL